MATVLLPETTRALYPFESHFLTLSDGKRMHYVDEGPDDGEILVFSHGYPMWSFVYRALIVYYAAQGYRCVAMDHIGFGLSDKPTVRRYHTIRRHIYNLLELLNTLELRDLTLIMENWGAPLALGYALRRPARVKRLVIMNSWAFQDTLSHRLHPLVRLVTRPGMGELLFGAMNLAFPLGVQRWTARQLSPAVLAAYRAPFRDARNRLALVQFPRMISTSPNHASAPMMREIESGLSAFRRVPSLIVWGEDDPVFPPVIAQHWKTQLPRAKGPYIIPRARHYLTEDAPDQLIEHIDRFLEAT